VTLLIVTGGWRRDVRDKQDNVKLCRSRRYPYYVIKLRTFDVTSKFGGEAAGKRTTSLKGTRNLECDLADVWEGLQEFSDKMKTVFSIFTT
jgi:hypothetical protein